MRNALCALFCLLLSACSSDRQMTSGEKTGIPDRAGQPKKNQVATATTKADSHTHWMHIILIEREGKKSTFSFLIERLKLREDGKYERSCDILQTNVEDDASLAMPPSMVGDIRFKSGNFLFTSKGEEIGFEQLLIPGVDKLAYPQAWILKSPNKGCSLPQLHESYKSFKWWEQLNSARRWKIVKTEQASGKKAGERSF